MDKQTSFTTNKVLHDLKHFLPAQAALKDFIHHNTLHSLQEYDFFTALQMGHEIFGYQTTLRLDEYKRLYWENKISDDTIDHVVAQASCDLIPLSDRKAAMLSIEPTNDYIPPKIGQIRNLWKVHFGFDMETIVNHSLFKIIGSYLDQGVSAVEFRSASQGFITTIKKLQHNTFFPLFKSNRVKSLLHENTHSIEQLLDILIGDERYYYQYLFDQQFSHPGWSGFVAVCESNPDMLFDKRLITLEEFIQFELLLEIDALDTKLGEDKWRPLGELVSTNPKNIFEVPVRDEDWYIRQWWQESLEMSYFDQVLQGLHDHNTSLSNEVSQRAKFQAFFCIDDREESLRRWIEKVEPLGQTFGTPAHFNLLIKYRPKGGKFNARSYEPCGR